MSVLLEHECGWSGISTPSGECPVCVEVPITERLWELELMQRAVRRTLTDDPPHVVAMATMIGNKAGLNQRHVERTPGRNDPCSCSSGRKYKRCCGA